MGRGASAFGLILAPTCSLSEKRGRGGSIHALEGELLPDALGLALPLLARGAVEVVSAFLGDEAGAVYVWRGTVVVGVCGETLVAWLWEVILLWEDWAGQLSRLQEREVPTTHCKLGFR